MSIHAEARGIRELALAFAGVAEHAGDSLCQREHVDLIQSEVDDVEPFAIALEKAALRSGFVNDHVLQLDAADDLKNFTSFLGE